MSVVERAVRKLQNSGMSESGEKREPIARVSQGQSKNSRRAQRDANEFALVDGDQAVVEFDLDALVRVGLYSAGNTRLADQYRMIKRPILKKTADAEQSIDEPGMNLLMVSSALAGEGKTFTSVNLSLSLASEKDWSVLLVDVDCRNPQLSRLLGVVDQPGLLDYLRDPTLPISSVVMTTNIEGLSVMPLGQVDDHAAELLASKRMRNLCANLSVRYPRQIVIFDSSPLLLTSESPILSSQVGQITLVVDANHSPRHAVMEAIDKLDHHKAIGLILNRADETGDVTAYGAYGAYGH